ncbi:hypothetical protein HRG_005890 [Hirsutella rhossiliensis]|uniref:Uncharacterized protein n=1 Tax=Hirsutella rhossiliensis TaxID=111463 RepID=A0A9P8SJ70_9HYPO|nr:uncharacterized protein HRG_05890 [Hirsutella rhossiliensis]KAH0963380.1 hypothetical protein HRG_05890 [Hirsutella rhossiliensis]
MLRSEPEVMSNFASDAISKGRVTMKPNLRAGSFLNGRSSAAAQPADLKFYHFDYLVDCPKAKQEGPLPSKSRKSNNQRKAERSLQEDSDFFANIRTSDRIQIESIHRSLETQVMTGQ